ncbi:MAG: calcium-binding protein [Hormoscilla sp. GM7CHS1pb]|nr:calcium-binding protein [Hormoscilla sp. GM7CHS1pb]
MNGTGQDDLLIGTPDDDDIRGRAGNDELRGEEGNDLLVGGQNDDTLTGGVDNDILFGGPGNDFFDGGAGDDIISGGLGQDMMIGGDGADIFVLSTNSAVDSRLNTDVILIFEVGIDSIGLTDGLTEADLDLQQLGTNTLIKIASSGQYLGLVNRTLAADIEGSFLSV